MDNIDNIIHESLWGDHDSGAEFPNQTPLLAHYTSINNFESILERGELWFSNPLNMNDSDELIFGMKQGAAEFRKSEALIKACGSEEIFGRLLEAFERHFDRFDYDHALDTYISCFSLHEENDYDGALSMWRGYGANGGGISFVIDTKKIEPAEDSPIILAPVSYSSNEERTEWIRQRIDQLAELLANFEKSNEILNSIAWNWIERLKVFSLFTKHKGFQEEKEWRFVYLNDRDENNHYHSMFGYYVSDQGVEPKLKLRLDQVPVNHFPLKLDVLIDRIILGPTASSVLSNRTLARMLEIKGKQELVSKVHASSIPYRP